MMLLARVSRIKQLTQQHNLLAEMYIQTYEASLQKAIHFYKAAPYARQRTVTHGLPGIRIKARAMRFTSCLICYS